jgi:hypothetical protein
MPGEKEVQIITDKQEINNIIQEKIKGKKLIFTDWYNIGIMRKGIPEEKFNEIFPQFDKVNVIEVEKMKKGDIGYELFYQMSNNTIFSIATIPKENSLLIIHLIEYKRSLDYRFKKVKP